MTTDNKALAERLIAEARALEAAVNTIRKLATPQARPDGGEEMFLDDLAALEGDIRQSADEARMLTPYAVSRWADRVAAIEQRNCVITRENFRTIYQAYKGNPTPAPDAVARLVEAAEAVLGVADHASFVSDECCCGSRMDDHCMGSGHAPVDSGAYYGGQALNSLQEALAPFIAAKQENERG